ncbi:unnamed protein product, partial [Meganyctiphanes norvegica]
SGDHDYKKRRFLVQDTKKVDCPASLIITRVATILDEEFQIGKNSSHRQRSKSYGHVRKALRKKYNLKWENQYYVLVPHVEDHEGHQISGEAAFFHTTVATRIHKRIEELAKEGQVTSVQQMQKFIKNYVKSSYNVRKKILSIR